MGQVGRAGLEPEELRVLVGHDLEHQAVEVRQRVPVRRLAPVARVAIEHQPLPGLVLAQDERARSDDLRGSGRRRPGLRERSGGQGGLELVLREDRQVVEQPHARPGWTREREAPLCGVEG